MNLNTDSILIKDTSGKMKTVSLSNKQKNNKTNKQLEVKNNNLFKKEDGLQKEIEKIIKEDKKAPVRDMEPTQKEEPKKEDEVSKKLKPIAPEETMPAFYFDLDHEKEVSQFRDKNKVVADKTRRNDLVSLIQQIIQKSEVELTEDTERRLKKAVELKLRGVRNVIGTKEVLQKKVAQGGLGLSAENSEKIIKLINSEEENFSKIQKTENNKLEKVEEKIIQPQVEIKPELKKIEQTQFQSQSQSQKKIIPTTQEIKSKSQDIRETRKEEFGQKEIKEQPQPQVQSQKQVRPQPQVSERRIMGPVDELANINLENFRRLGKNVLDVLKKIKEKINLMQEESFERRAEGIKAWQQSAVYKEYLILGQESMEQGKSIQEVIENKKNKNLQTLSFEEFEAIADFNENLNY